MKKLLILTLALALVMGLSACNTTKEEPSSQPDVSAPSEDTSSEAEGSGDELEISIDTYFHGTKETDGETVGVYAHLVWYADRVDFEISEYSADFSNVIFTQTGTVERTEDDVIVIERENAVEGAEVPEEQGTITIELLENTLNYKVNVGETEDAFELNILTEDEAAELTKAA